MSLARFALLAAAFSMVSPARGAETIRWAPKPGETLRYTLAHTSESKLSGPGEELSQKSELGIDLTWKVVSVAPDGAIELGQTLDRVRIKETAPGRVTTFDTQDRKAADPASPFAKAYEVLVGKPYTIRLSPQGEVLDVKLPEGAATALGDSPVLVDVGSFYSAAGMKNILAQLLPRLPKDPVDGGATWDDKSTVNAGPLKVDFAIRYTLAEAAPVAAIDATLTTNLTPAPEANFTFKINKQSGTARFAFDTKAGHLDSTEMKQSAEMTIGSANLQRTQTTDVTMSFRLRK